MRKLALIAAAGLLLAGCGSSHTASPGANPAPHSRYPVVIHAPVVLQVPREQQGKLGIDSVKFISRTRLGIVTVGSGSCPWVPEKLTVIGRDKIEIRLAEGGFRNGRAVIYSGRYGCTMDLGPTRMLVAIDPKLIDVHRRVTVRFFYKDHKQPHLRIAAPTNS